MHSWEKVEPLNCWPVNVHVQATMHNSVKVLIAANLPLLSSKDFNS